MPVEFDFDAAVGIGPDFLFGWSDDGGGLTGGLRFGDGAIGNDAFARRTEQQFAVKREVLGIALGGGFLCGDALSEYEPVDVAVFVRVVGQGEAVADLYAARITLRTRAVAVLAVGLLDVL